MRESQPVNPSLCASGRDGPRNTLRSSTAGTNNDETTEVRMRRILNQFLYRAARPRAFALIVAVLALAAPTMFTALGTMAARSRAAKPAAQGRAQDVSLQGVSGVFLPDGRLLITGGRAADGPLADSWIVGTDGLVTRVASMMAARSNHASALLADGRVLIAGGYGASGALASAEIYDLVSDTWSSIATMTEARTGLTATLLADGRVLMAGGNSLDLFDPQTSEFSYAGSLNPPRTGQAAAMLLDGRVLLTGGISAGSAIMFADVYNPVSGLMAHVSSPLGTARFGHTATTLGDGRVLIAGGSNGNADLASVELYDPISQSFSTSALTLSIPRSNQIAQLLPNGAQVMISGGRSGAADVTTSELLNVGVAEAGTAPKTASTTSVASQSTQATTLVFAAAGGGNPSADLDQCANDPAPSPNSDGCNSLANQWVNGNLGASKANYFEGDSIPYRLRFDNLSLASHTVTIEWDTTKSSKHALDYIDSFNQSVLTRILV